MVSDLKIVASVLGTAVALVAYVPYLIAMFRGKNKPHLYTWISIFLITAVVAYIQLIGGAGAGAIPVIVGVAVDAIILFYCFKFGTKDVVAMDKLFLGIAIMGVIAYILLNNRPIIALAIVTLAEILSFVPTFRKTRNDPYSESLPSYYLVMLKLLLILAALRNYNALTVSYPLLWIVVFIVFLIATYRWRSQKTPPAVHRNVEEAPLV